MLFVSLVQSQGSGEQFAMPLSMRTRTRSVSVQRGLIFVTLICYPMWTYSTVPYKGVCAPSVTFQPETSMQFVRLESSNTRKCSNVKLKVKLTWFYKEKSGCICMKISPTIRVKFRLEANWQRQAQKA